MTMDGDMKMRSELEPKGVRCHHELWNKGARAVSMRVRHASVEVQVHCVNLVIGVVLGELHRFHIGNHVASNGICFF